MKNLESIETLHNGIHFRSRLEARWAIVLETLEIKFEYEPKLFDFGGIRYIPDFLLPEQSKWIEIKGEMPTALEIQKAGLLSKETKQDVVILSGLFRFNTFVCNYCSAYHHITIPSGVGITYFKGGKSSSHLPHIQVDEFIFWFLGKTPTALGPHADFIKIHQAFSHALSTQFPITPTEQGILGNRKLNEVFFDLNQNLLENDDNS